MRHEGDGLDRGVVPIYGTGLVLPVAEGGREKRTRISRVNEDKYTEELRKESGEIKKNYFLIKT